jgi:formate-dependent nitrite reductase membrane component NrfD
MMKPPVWTWEVPVYFWTGGMAAGASFVALACDLVGDAPSARVARRVVLGALAASPPLLILDLGRPSRFYNMLRIVKPRSPMSMGSWCLTAFGALGTGAVGADVLGRHRTARALGAANAVVGGYLGSYTGVLLASTAVPLWARSRLFLGPIFVSTAVLTGAAATRLVLAAGGMPAGHPTGAALGRVESGAMAAELVLSEMNRHRLGPLASVLDDGAGAPWFTAAKWLTRGGLTLRLLGRRLGPASHHTASSLFMASALCFRFAWVRAGRTSAQDDEAVARMAR